MGFITDEERQEPLRVGDIPSTFAFMRRKRHLSGSGVFFYHQILPLNSDKRSTLYKGKSTIPVIDEIEEEPVEFRFVNCAAGRDRVIPVSQTVRKD